MATAGSGLLRVTVALWLIQATFPKGCLLSRGEQDAIALAFDKSVDDNSKFLLGSRHASPPTIPSIP